MPKTADDYWDDSAGIYRFPNLRIALHFADDIPEDSEFTVSNDSEFRLLRMVERSLR